jgi:hypothetical protein
MAGMREFLNSNGGKIAATALLILAIALAVFMFRSSFGAPSDIAAANDRVFIDATTGKPFSRELKPGMAVPIEAPSGKKTGYPAEMCWWTKDGKVRKEPYPVLLNTWVGKPEPTFCPDCGRLVVPHNPSPGGGGNLTPPPIKQDFKGAGPSRDR